MILHAQLLIPYYPVPSIPQGCLHYGRGLLDATVRRSYWAVKFGKVRWEHEVFFHGKNTTFCIQSRYKEAGFHQ